LFAMLFPFPVQNVRVRVTGREALRA
jgi:hypothetical protein